MATTVTLPKIPPPPPVNQEGTIDAAMYRWFTQLLQRLNQDNTNTTIAVNTLAVASNISTMSVAEAGDLDPFMDALSMLGGQLRAEEGPWTPTQGAGLTVIGAFGSTGRYVKIGRLVTVTGVITGATTIAVAAAGVFVGGLPYLQAAVGVGGAVNAAQTAGCQLTGNINSASLIAAGAVAATPSLTFSITYLTQ